MRLSIKNMVCPRCVSAVRHILTDIGYNVSEANLGYAVIDSKQLSCDELSHIAEKLHEDGFELIYDSDDVLVEAVKIAIINIIREEGSPTKKISVILEEKSGVDYATISRVFSKKEGRTIEKFYIAQRVEYVKELIGYNSMSTTDIAYRAGYSSVAHLSRQFAQVTGMTITEYRNTNGYRKSLDEV
jgi:AraC-like DNA-binding protein